ncbi:xylulokinase [Enterococcus nangangensis]|uniref:xylulokinase n=1 Tax=Enterococcus nangangensis TaxID=2559926 RepID=UPI0010F6B77A|nr:FGGY-family carbohydrate kinase [Enterococcus nangangensis]
MEQEQLFTAPAELFLGIEFGSTKIKALLLDENQQVIASGDHGWENQLKDGFWTYDLTDVVTGLQDCYGQIKQTYQEKFNQPLTQLAGLGISAMMHGYLAFNAQDELLVPFRTWRNTTTGEASRALSAAFHYNVPERWSIAHLYQALLNQEEHVSEVSFFTTLAGWVHWQLTGTKVLGVGDASGMFPINEKTKNYDEEMAATFNHLAKDHGVSLDVLQLLPKVLVAGETAGELTAAGAKLLDPSGDLLPGVPLCPPEGDAGTGMVATNSVTPKTGNVSAGTSVFAMVVLEKALQEVYPEIDLVTTPSGDPVAMVHANNCSSEINAWMHLFKELTETLGLELSYDELFAKIFPTALTHEANVGDLLSYGYYSGESITQMAAGRPLFVRQPDSNFSLGNFIRVQLFSAFATLKIGMDLLAEEQVAITKIYGHGGIFKTPVVAQQILAGALKTPVTVTQGAEMGGAFGMGLLASYLPKARTMSLAEFLQQTVFADVQETTVEPVAADVEAFKKYMTVFKQGLAIEASAVKNME